MDQLGNLTNIPLQELPEYIRVKYSCLNNQIVAGENALAFTRHFTALQNLKSKKKKIYNKKRLYD